MGEQTTIGWTDHTFNPWWGCTKSPARTARRAPATTATPRRSRSAPATTSGGKDAPRRFFGDKHWAEPLKWERAAAAGEPGPNTGRPDHLVFCASMADVFEARDDLYQERKRLWPLIAATPHLTWLLLTKRPENVCGPGQWTVPPEWIEEEGDWPANVWVGTTVEDQARADLRVRRLVPVPAAVHFLSCEPLLGPVDLTYWLQTFAIQWVICGGESGPGHRPLDLDHARRLRDQCITAGVPFFFKQVGGRTPTTGGDLLDGELWKQFPEGALR